MQDEFYKLYLSKHGYYDKKIVRNTMVQIHEEIQQADPIQYDGYIVIEHIISLDQDNIVAMGKIQPKEEYKSHTRER
jgi:hypothetical protein